MVCYFAFCGLAVCCALLVVCTLVFVVRCVSLVVLAGLYLSLFLDVCCMSSFSALVCCSLFVVGCLLSVVGSWLRVVCYVLLC